MPQLSVPRHLYAAFVALVIAVGLAISFSPVYGLLLLGLVLVVVTAESVQFLVFLIAITLPFSASVGTSVGPIFVSLCDMLAVLYLVLSFTGPRYVYLSRQHSAVGVKRLAAPIISFSSVYFFVAVLNSVIQGHGASTYLDIVQRLQLTILWTIVGIFLYRQRQIKLFLVAFVASSALLSVVWVATPGVGAVLGVQKNPSGGFIAAAVIIAMVANIRPTARILLILILVGGLISTGSRGSMLGLAVGILCLSVFRNQWRKVVIPCLLAIFGAAVTLRFLPPEVADRIFSESSSGIYNIRIREIFVQDALEKFEAAPYSGVGVGNYVQSHPMLQRVETLDPHNVYALTLAEGGYPLFAGFVIMAFGSLIYIALHRSPYAPLAIAIQVSILAHAYVDLYWVRGTPAMGWLLVGVAIACAKSGPRLASRIPPKKGSPSKPDSLKFRSAESASGSPALK